MEFEAGKSYCISTEKAVETLPGAPWPSLIKQSMYAIKTLTETPKEPDAWWTATDKPHIVLSKRGAQYILCTLDRDAIRGTSEFIDPESGEIFTKRDISKWLPYSGPFGAYFCVKIESIRQVDMIQVDEEEPLMDPNGPMAQILKDKPF